MRGTEIPGGFCEGYVIINDIEHLSTHIYINISVLSLLNTIKIDFEYFANTHSSTGQPTILYLDYLWCINLKS